jgi:hypothetical protein
VLGEDANIDVVGEVHIGNKTPGTSTHYDEENLVGKGATIKGGSFHLGDS